MSEPAEDPQREPEAIEAWANAWVKWCVFAFMALIAGVCVFVLVTQTTPNPRDTLILRIAVGILVVLCVSGAVVTGMLARAASRYPIVRVKWDQPNARVIIEGIWFDGKRARRRWLRGMQDRWVIPAADLAGAEIVSADVVSKRSRSHTYLSSREIIYVLTRNNAVALGNTYADPVAFAMIKNLLNSVAMHNQNASPGTNLPRALGNHLGVYVIAIVAALLLVPIMVALVLWVAQLP